MSHIAMFRMLLSLLLPMFTLTRPALAIEALDPRFSGDGIAIIDQGEDWPVITCPAAGGKRLLVNRTGESAITTSRLFDSGQLDPQFGTGGTAVVAVTLNQIDAAGPDHCGSREAGRAA
ncbi:MAG: hypothetical protein KDI51_04955 [Xanthomonadales bacterium]|nr:hypothetical protein [Xanthomonadales bacterium]